MDVNKETNVHTKLFVSLSKLSGTETKWKLQTSCVGISRTTVEEEENNKQRLGEGEAAEDEEKDVGWGW